MRAVLFDVDGVLLDSIGFHQGVWQRYCATRQLDFARVWPSVLRSRWPEVVALHASEREANAELRFLESLCDEMHELITAPDGVPELLAALPAGRWGIVTSGSGSALVEIFPRLGLPLPKVLVDGPRVTLGKPHPEGYLTAARELATDPSRCLVVEDTPGGIDAGRAAGMRVVAVQGTFPASALTMADAVVPSMRDAGVVAHEWLSTG